jgi:hypothetical protein
MNGWTTIERNVDITQHILKKSAHKWRTNITVQDGAGVHHFIECMTCNQIFDGKETLSALMHCKAVNA